MEPPGILGSCAAVFGELDVALELIGRGRPVTDAAPVTPLAPPRGTSWYDISFGDGDGDSSFGDGDVFSDSSSGATDADDIGSFKWDQVPEYPLDTPDAIEQQLTAIGTDFYPMAAFDLDFRLAVAAQIEEHLAKPMDPFSAHARRLMQCAVKGLALHAAWSFFVREQAEDLRLSATAAVVQAAFAAWRRLSPRAQPAATARPPGGTGKVKSGGTDKVKSGGTDKVKSGGINVKSGGTDKAMSGGITAKAKRGGTDKVMSGGISAKIKVGGIDKVLSGGRDKVMSGGIDEVVSGGHDMVWSGGHDKVLSDSFSISQQKQLMVKFFLAELTVSQRAQLMAGYGMESASELDLQERLIRDMG